MRAAALLLCATLFACAPEPVTPAKWQSMSHDDRVLYVQTLLGAEKAKEAKGGNAKSFDAAPEDYVKRIEAAYARGDARAPDAIFAELGK